MPADPPHVDATFLPRAIREGLGEMVRLLFRSACGEPEVLYEVVAGPCRDQSEAERGTRRGHRPRDVGAGPIPSDHDQRLDPVVHRFGGESRLIPGAHGRAHI